MLRSLYTGISGMRSMQTMMDVTGNNIANVNTTGYKTANTVFSDTLSQTLASAGAPSGQQGGTNPAQVGLGVRVAGITTNFTQGATQTTGRNTDMLISGDGFFAVRNNGVTQYTRNGSFTPDAKGQLVGLGGAQVMGWTANPVTGAINTTDATGPVTIPTGLLSNPKATDTLILSGNLNNAATGDDPTTAAPVNEAKTAGSEFPINWPIYDKQGKSSDISLTVTPQKPTTGATITSWAISGSYGNPAQTFNGTLSIPATGARTWTNGTGGTITTTDAGGGKIKVPGLTGSDTAAFDVVLDTTKLTSSAQSGQSSTAKVDSQNGYPAAALSSWNMGPDGTITGTFSSGVTQTLAKVAVAMFDNPAGLSKDGGSLYSATVNSGNASIGSAGEAGRGTLVSGALEMSNVDLAQEFTNLIVSQRGFQANSRVITTSDSMLEELVNLKR